MWQRSLSAEIVQQKLEYCELAGAAAVDILRNVNAAVSIGRGQYINAIMVFLEKQGVNNKPKRK